MALVAPITPWVLNGEPRVARAAADAIDALLRGAGPAFYQYIERDYHGEKSTPWEGGRYGFVRNPVETSAGIIYTRLHEGMDIKPLQRDDIDLDRELLFEQRYRLQETQAVDIRNIRQFQIVRQRDSGPLDHIRSGW